LPFFVVVIVVIVVVRLLVVAVLALHIRKHGNVRIRLGKDNVDF
jgi:hypothetical protein